MQQVYFEGQWKAMNEVKIPISNRSFRYGDGLFESFLYHKGQWIFAQHHWRRLSAGAAALAIQLPNTLQEKITSALSTLSNDTYACRLQLWRAGAGKYTPNTNESQWLLEINTSTDNYLHKTNQAGLNVALGNTMITPSTLSPYKTNSGLEYVLAGVERKQKKLDDLLLSNIFGELVEASSSNIFLLKDNTISTPSLESGCLAGCIRAVLIEMIKNKPKWVIQERKIFLQELEEANEIWLTNSIHGIRWVKQCGKRKFDRIWAESFQNKLIEKALEITMKKDDV